jgi:hypothetical protein
MNRLAAIGAMCVVGGITLVATAVVQVIVSLFLTGLLR